MVIADRPLGSWMFRNDQTEYTESLVKLTSGYFTVIEQAAWVYWDRLTEDTLHLWTG